MATHVQPADAGSVAVTPSGGAVLEGTSVSFKATPKGDYVFSGWSGSLSGSENPATITVTADVSVTANFTLRNYPLTLSVEGEGSIEEKVVSTKADYASGTVVELTAVPASGWSFDHWEGNLTGGDNPARITISSAQFVKAVFTRQKYAYNLKIIGNGVVDEFVLQNTKSSADFGTRILLKAIPSEGSVFKGWYGDYSGTNPELEFTLEEGKEITAEFSSWKSLSFPLPDLLKSSAQLKRFYPDYDFSWFCNHCNGYLPIDYNRDGYLDIVTFLTDWSPDSRLPIRFYLGDEDGFFSPDPDNDMKMLGMINNRKTVFGDFNGDGYPDIGLIGHGYDEDPWPGEYPVILLSQGGPEYKDIRFTDFVSYYHGGASGDIDNDGDIDLVLVDAGRGKSIVLLNDGSGNYDVRTDLIEQSLMQGMTICELFDLDHDGHMDLICAGDDTSCSDRGVSWPWNAGNCPIVFWGTKETGYVNSPFIRLPESNIRGYDGTIDMTFYDLDGDGHEEIIISRTGSIIDEIPEHWHLQILKREGRNFIDATDYYLDYEDSYSTTDGMLFWIGLQQYKDNKIYLLAQDGGCNASLYFMLDSGRLTPINNETSSLTTIQEGICVYSEYTMDEAFRADYINPACAETSFSGSHCISFEGWTEGEGFRYIFDKKHQNGADFSFLRENGYALEFAIRNSDPMLKISIDFESIIDFEKWKLASYYWIYDAKEHACNGEWERIVIPFGQFSENENVSSSNENFWTKIDQLSFQMISPGGNAFYLDEIRIRKILPE
mgnify:CR=1 FL=1